ncbi:MAG: ABC transporter substrate-binding protein [Rhodospirillaceae bacterium]|nr:ABC transporter substrate-binding protein [Rhodospirillaceae bacterium]
MTFKQTTRSLVLAGVAAALFAGPAMAEGAKIGFLGGITGPIQGAVPPIIDAARLAVKHVNEQGGLLGGKLSFALADSKCDPQSSVAAANKLVNVENVAGIIGALCSGATIGAANAAAVPAGVVMISPASTSPAITELKDKDFVFRVAPSDSFQGKVLARVVLARGIKKVAMTYVKNDYGKGLADNFRTEFTKGGGQIAGDQAHEDKKSSYRSELATLKKGGAQHLVLIAYPQSSAPVIIRQSLEGGLFSKFIGPEAIYDEKMWKTLGIKNIEGLIYTRPAAQAGPSLDAYNRAMKAAYPKSHGKLFTAQTYDATFMLALAIAKAGSSDRTKVRDALRSISSGKGMKILPGQWKEAIAAIKAGKEVDYAGATGDLDFDSAGDIAGSYNQWQIKEGKAVNLGVAR